MSQPVFRDVRHALHVSFLIHSMPATSPSPTAIVIDRLVKECHVWDGLPVRREGAVNFSGLSTLEVRAQCAQVVAMVNHLKHPAESAAVKAMFGHQVIKAAGVRDLAQYCEPTIGSVTGMAALACAWNVFGTERQRSGLGREAIAEEFGVSERAVRDAVATIRKMGLSLYARADEALTERFERGELIEKSYT